MADVCMNDIPMELVSSIVKMDDINLDGMVRVKASIDGLPAQMDIHFDDKGMEINCDGKSQFLPWSKITNAFKQLNMIVIMSDDKHGYMITDRVLLEKKDEFFDFVCDKIRK